MEKFIVVDVDDGVPDSMLTRLEHLLPSEKVVPPLDPEYEAIVREITGGDYAYLP